MAINSLGTPLAMQIRPLDLLRDQQIRGARQINDANAQELQRENALRSFYQQNGAGILQGDQNALGQLAGMDPALAYKYQQNYQAGQTNKANLDKAQLESKLTQMGIVLSAVNAVRHAGPSANKQKMYETVKGNVQNEYGFQFPDAPAEYSDEWADTVIASGMSLQEQLKQQQQMPQTRTLEQGPNKVTQQFDPHTQTFSDIATAPLQRETPALSPERYRQEQDLRGITANRGGAGGGRTLTERNRSIVINGNPSSPEYAAAYADMAKPRIVFDPNTGETIQIAPDMTWARKPGSKEPPTGVPPSVSPVGAGEGEGRPDITRGPGRSGNPTYATYESNVSQATADISKAEKMFFPGAAYKDGKLGGGKFDRGIAFTGSTSIPGAGPGVPLTQGREARQTIRRAVEIMLRLRTGAAAPESEVNTYTDLFSPSALDNESGARTKMERMRQFFEESKEIARSKLPQRGAAEAAPAGDGWTVKKRAP